MTPVTYGRLLANATAYMREGNRQVHEVRLDDRDHAHHAIAAYSALLETVARHILTVVGHARVAGLAASPHTDTLETAAVRLAEVLPHHPHDLPFSPTPPAPPGHAWALAAGQLRAASDLLSTHVTPRGEAHTPDANVVWDADARSAALARLGAFTATLVSAQDALALRAGQAGVSWSAVRRWLPSTATTLELAEAVRQASRVMDADGQRFDDLAPATMAVHDGTLHDELIERVARIRRTAWSLASNPDYSVRTLDDVARAGFLTAAYTARFHHLDLHDPTTANRHPVARRVHAWLHLMGDLRGYQTPAPGNTELRHDTAAIHDLLETLVPTAGPDAGRGDAPASVPDRELAGVLHGAVAGTAQAAQWCGTAFARLARSGQIYLPARALTGDELTDRADLAEVRLQRPAALVPAPAQRTEHTLDLFHAVTTAHTGRSDDATTALQQQRPQRDESRCLSRATPA